MRNSLFALVGLISFTGALVAGEVKALDPTDQADKLGYSIGYQLGSGFRDE